MIYKRETVGEWTANHCLKGCEVRLLESQRLGPWICHEKWGAFKKGKLIDTKTNY